MKIGDKVTVFKISPDWHNGVKKAISEAPYGVVTNISEEGIFATFGPRSFFFYKDTNKYPYDELVPYYSIVVGETYSQKDGTKVRIISTNGCDPDYPVIGIYTDKDGDGVRLYTKEGLFSIYTNDQRDLILSTNYDDFKIDEPVLYRTAEGDSWFKGYFAGVVNNAPQVWSEGRASWTTTCKQSVLEVKKHD